VEGGKQTLRLRPFVIIFSFLFAFIFLLFPYKGLADQNNQVVYVVPIEDTVEKGLSAFLERAIETAEKESAEMIVFEINTPGGAVNAATEIGKLLTSTEIHTVSFINNEALSAGAYIALNSDEIYMVPGSTIGAAAIIDQAGNAADEKAQSFWLSAMKGAAEQNGRDPKFALAMADKEVDLPEYGAPAGKLLTLTSTQAEKAGYSEGTVASLDDLFQKLGYAKADVRSVDESFAEKLARFLTNPLVVPILLSIGSLGIVIELFSPGFGLPGFVGLTALVLFFYGHMVAGLAGFETLVLFALGIGLIILEMFVPGGIVGSLGVISILGSLFLATDNVVYMGISILIAVTVSVLASILMVKVFGKKMKFFRKIILTDSTSTESGYISNENRPELIGKEGITLTPLRPAGTITVEDERIDVVSEGDFIQKDKRVKIIKTEGSRIVVREITNLNKDQK
jgi:membrane-bound serine protease (ClpP class)